MAKRSRAQTGNKKVTRYTYDDVKEPSQPETGHTPLLPGDEQVVTLPMDNGWTKAVEVGHLPEDDERAIVVDMDPAADPVLFWAGKRNRREIPVLPLQRNEVVSESRIAHIVERARRAVEEKEPLVQQLPLFSDLEKALRESDKDKRVEFYTHDEGWKNKLICGDSLQVIESLLQYESLRGKVQMIYIDPPYGIDYDSNFQQRVDSTENRKGDLGDDILTVKAFRDTWALGIHSYLSYLQERLYLCRELLSDTGSVFVQISLTNVHVVRNLLDEVFGRNCFISQIAFIRAAGRSAAFIDDVYDVLLWYCKDRSRTIYRPIYRWRSLAELGAFDYIETEDGELVQLTREQIEGEAPLPKGKRLMLMDHTSQGESENSHPIVFEGKEYYLRSGRHWSTTEDGTKRLIELRRIASKGSNIFFKRYTDDFPLRSLWNIWDDTVISGFMRSHESFYKVETPPKVIERCLLMTSEPGNLVFDPTCGGGATAYVAEKWGRRWITCDTSRVAVNVTRRRLLSATFEHFATRNGQVGSGFLYKTIQRIKRESLAYNLEPEKVELVDQPEIDKKAFRVCGPFEVMTLGRYSAEDWKGYVTESGKLENYISVICRLYRKDAAIQGANGLVHAIAESEKDKIAISVGPLTGRVTAKQINDAVQDALALGTLETHVLGWAFEANVGEIKSQLESRGKMEVHLIMIRPDTLVEGLKVTQPEMLFSPLALPDIEVSSTPSQDGQYITVTLKGVGVFDRKRRTTDYYRADSGYVAAWYLDEDYDGDCFVDCQMFFDFSKTPNLKAALKADIDADEFRLQLTSQPFPVRVYKRIAVKVVDVYGNESTVVKDLA